MGMSLVLKHDKRLVCFIGFVDVSAHIFVNCWSTYQLPYRLSIGGLLI